MAACAASSARSTVSTLNVSVGTASAANALTPVKAANAVAAMSARDRIMTMLLTGMDGCKRYHLKPPWQPCWAPPIGPALGPWRKSRLQRIGFLNDLFYDRAISHDLQRCQFLFCLSKIPPF